MFFKCFMKRFQAPGEQVEITKSLSQPHLNGVQGYVDFSCLAAVAHSLEFWR